MIQSKSNICIFSYRISQFSNYILLNTIKEIEILIDITIFLLNKKNLNYFTLFGPTSIEFQFHELAEGHKQKPS